MVRGLRPNRSPGARSFFSIRIEAAGVDDDLSIRGKPEPTAERLYIWNIPKFVNVHAVMKHQGLFFGHAFLDPEIRQILADGDKSD